MAAAYDSSRLIWSADWFINDVELPTSLPAPVCTPHELCKRAAKTIKKHTNQRSGDDKLILHWPLQNDGLVVQGGDYLRLIVKASYKLNENEAAAGVVDRSHASEGGGATASGGSRWRSSSKAKVLLPGGASAVASSAGSSRTASNEASRRRRPKGSSKTASYAWSQSAQRAVRFFTRERRIYVQQLVVHCPASPYLPRLDPPKSTRSCGTVSSHSLIDESPSVTPCLAGQWDECANQGDSPWRGDGVHRLPSEWRICNRARGAGSGQPSTARGGGRWTRAHQVPSLRPSSTVPCR